MVSTSGQPDDSSPLAQMGHRLNDLRLDLYRQVDQLRGEVRFWIVLNVALLGTILGVILSGAG